MGRVCGVLCMGGVIYLVLWRSDERSTVQVLSPSFLYRETPSLRRRTTVNRQVQC